MRQRIRFLALLALLLSACAPPPAPPTGPPRPTAPPPTPPPAARPVATPSGGPPTGSSSTTLPPPPTCADLACPWTTLNIARLQGHTPDANVLKLFSAAVDPVRQRVYVAGILTRPIAVLDAASGQWLGTVDSGIDGSAYRYLYLDPVANYLYILDDSHHHLFRLDLNTDEMAGPASLPEHVGRIAVDTHRARLYLTTPDAPTFRAIDGRTLQTLYTADLGPDAGPIAFAEKSDALYIAPTEVSLVGPLAASRPSPTSSNASAQADARRATPGKADFQSAPTEGGLPGPAATGRPAPTFPSNASAQADAWRATPGKADFQSAPTEGGLPGPAATGRPSPTSPLKASAQADARRTAPTKANFQSAPTEGGPSALNAQNASAQADAWRLLRAQRHAPSALAPRRSNQAPTEADFQSAPTAEARRTAPTKADFQSAPMADADARRTAPTEADFQSAPTADVGRAAPTKADFQSAPGQIFRLDPETGQVVETISYNASPAGRPRFLAADDARARLIVATDRVVQVLDLTGREVNAFPLPRAGELQDLAYDPVREHLIALWLEMPSEGRVAATGAHLQVYDLNTGRTLHELSFGAKPHRLTLDAASGKLYIPEGDASVLWQIDTSTYAEAVPLRLGDSVEQVVTADGGRRLFLTSRLGGSYLLAFDLETGDWETFTSGTWPIPIRTDAGGEHLFVLNAWDSTLSIYDAASPGTPLATIPLGLPRGTTDRLPDLAIDTSHRRACAAYPEFGKIAVVDWEARKAVGTIEVAGFPTGDTGGGPGQLQVAVDESAGLLYAFWKDERRLTVYDIGKYSLLADRDLRSLDWRVFQGAPGTGNLFVDAGRGRLFVGPFELDGRTGQPTGRRLARGQQVLALDETAGAYWAVGVEQETNVLVLVDRETLQARAVQSLGPVGGTGESFTLDPAHGRLYVGRMTAAELEIWVLGGPASSGTAPATPTAFPATATAAPTVPSAESAGSPDTYRVTNPASGARLYVQVVRPRSGSGPFPALVLVPGATDDGSFFIRTGRARALADAGFLVVLFDPDGRGRSEGEENLNGHTHQDGLAAVIRFAATLPDVDAARIGLVTYSYGVTMGTGALARHSDLPVRFLIDWEGPANRRYTTGNCSGRVGGIRWPPCSDDAFWSEREAVTFIGQIRVPYQRIQSERDHAQPVVTHAVEMVNAAVAGGVPWVRLNDGRPNQTYDPNNPPRMLPEAADRHLEDLIARYAQELFGR